MKISRSARYAMGPMVLTLFLLAGSTGCGENGTHPMNDIFREYGFYFRRLPAMRPETDFSQQARGMEFRTIIGQVENMRLEVKAISPITAEDAKRHSMAKYEIIKDLYGPQIIPYPAFISRSTGAPESKKPMETAINMAGKNTKVIIANASERYVLGVWDESQIAQKALFAMFYVDRTSTSLEITLFVPADKDLVSVALETMASFRLSK
ncbi:MAG: hypothetical protein GF408_04320 [Candidatus Omnitrophica bacterium]|nr:hypothetical protein [Candidatus Omnitrophota bacterium]